MSSLFKPRPAPKPPVHVEPPPGGKPVAKPDFNNPKPQEVPAQPAATVQPEVVNANVNQYQYRLSKAIDTASDVADLMSVATDLANAILATTTTSDDSAASTITGTTMK